MFTKIYKIITLIAGESKQGYYDSAISQYQFNCPNCAEENGGEPDGKYNLEINFELGRIHCWKCGTKGKISYLIKKHGSPELLKAYYDEVEFIKNSKLYNLSAFDDVEESIFDDKQEELKLPRTYSKINLSNCRNKMLLRYLEKRHITQDIVDRYNIGYTGWDEDKSVLKNRIIIPSYDTFGNLNYWTGRDFAGEYYDKKKKENPEYKYERMKYWNCKEDKNKIIFQESLIQWDADIILVEGAMDCLYYTGNCVSMLGKTLTKDCALYKKLYEKANANIIICIDADTDMKEVKRLYALLDNGRLRDKIRYIRLDKYKDFGEVYENEGKEGIIKTIQTQQKFEDIDMVF